MKSISEDPWKSPGVEWGEDRGYLLTLGDGQRRVLCADEGMTEWLSRFAAILRLAPGCVGNGPVIYYMSRGGVSPRLFAGWECHPLRFFRVWCHPKSPDMILESSWTWEEKRFIPYIMMHEALSVLCADLHVPTALPLHTAALARDAGDGGAVALLAPSGTGKSTCAARVPSPWEPLCDDMALIVRDSDGAFRLHPLPTWSEVTMRGRTDLTWDVCRHLPLQAVYLLEQGDRDRVTEVGNGEATAAIFRSSVQIMTPYLNRLDPADVIVLKRRFLENACTLASALPAFRLRATISGRFWEAIEGSLADER